MFLCINSNYIICIINSNIDNITLIIRSIIVSSSTINIIIVVFYNRQYYQYY